MTNFDDPQYRLAKAISDLSAKVKELEASGAYRDPGIIANTCYIETGTYTGDGTLSNVVSLTDSDLVVKFVRIYQRITIETNANAWETTPEIIDDHASGMSFASAAAGHVTRINRIIGVGVGSFTVDDDGADGNPNKNGAVYNYMVIGTH